MKKLAVPAFLALLFFHSMLWAVDYFAYPPGSFPVLGVINTGNTAACDPGYEPAVGADGKALFDANGDLLCFSTGTAYGVVWNQSTDTYQIGTISNGTFTVEAVSSFPIQEQMKRVVLTDAGDVAYELCVTDSTDKADCATASVLDGTDGQVMVQIPAFHYIQIQDGDYRYFLVGESRFYLISSGETLNTSAVHEAFYKGGSATASDYRYIGAYEGYNDGGDLASINDVLPTVSQTRATFRGYAEARGTGWHQVDAYLYAAISILYLTEYGDFYTQSEIGIGITDYEAWPNGPQALTGNSNAIGNATGNSTIAVDKWNATTAYAENEECIPDATQNTYTYRATVAGTSAGSEPTWPTTLSNTVVDGTVTWTCVRSNQYMSYRGIENWYGHIWKFIDGVNVHNSTANRSRLYLCGDYTAFADDTDTGYDLAGLLPEAYGYPVDIIDTIGIWPSAVGGSSSTYLTDYYYTYFDNNNDSGWRVARVGGGADDGSNAGAFCVGSTYAPSLESSNIGGRLCF